MTDNSASNMAASLIAAAADYLEQDRPDQATVAIMTAISMQLQAMAEQLDVIGADISTQLQAVVEQLDVIGTELQGNNRNIRLK